MPRTSVNHLRPHPIFLTKTTPESGLALFLFRNFNGLKIASSLQTSSFPHSLYLPAMASWKASFAPLLRSAARLSETITANNTAFSCKFSLQLSSSWSPLSRYNVSNPILTSVRRMASYERKKPHVNIGKSLLLTY